MKVPIGFWRPEPGESEADFDERVFGEIKAAIDLLRGAGDMADPEAAPEAAPEVGGAA